MKMFITKYSYLIVFTILLISIGIYGFIHTELPDIRSNIPITFIIESGESNMHLSLYQAEDRQCYVFLPSHAQMEQVKINTTANADISIGNTQIYDGIYCNVFEPGKNYVFKINNRPDMTLTFYQSANVATLYIDTATGSMTRIHNNKDYEEPSSLTLFLPNGEVSYSDQNCHLKGRGNSTWGQDKKPYSLTLSSSASLLGMTPSTDWVLLANAFDNTNLRNKIVYDLSAETSPAWTPSCEYADVYLNGSYNGLYLLSERIEADPAHLDIAVSDGSFLCKVDHSDRWDFMRHPFKSSLGRSIEITGPKELTSDAAELIQHSVNEMESIFLSTASDLTFANIDLDSWVYKYLIDEISGNGDADLASSYFYYEDGTFYAGPVWDYDNSFGNTISNENPIAFTAKNYHKAPYYRSPYYASLYNNKHFYNHMVEMYKTVFQPLLYELLDTGIPELSQKISKASGMNSIRWQSMFEQNNLHVSTPQELMEYLQQRIDFLNNAWINGTDYCTVQFQTLPHGRYYNYAVKKGECIDISGLETDFTTWYNADTGEIFDIAMPITEDIALISQYEQ